MGHLDEVIHLANQLRRVPAHHGQDTAAPRFHFLDVGNDFCVDGISGSERDHGHIVITSSLTAYRGLPGSIGYTASKAATLSLAESMHADLRKTGVQVQVINPGFIKTQLTDKNDFKMPFLMEPKDAARRVYEHMNGDSFKLDFPYGFSLLFRLGRFLPDWLYYRFFS